MKRRRRVEIVRYRRRVTVTRGMSEAAGPAAGQPPGDRILEALALLPPAEEREVPDEAAAGGSVRRGLLAWLSGLHRQRRG